MDGIKAMKRTLRKDIDTKLRQLTAEEIATASAQLTAHLVLHPAFVQAKTVCAYLPMPNEASTLAIIDEIFAQGKKLYVPKVTGPRSEDMLMLHVASQRDIDLFPKSKWNIPEPLLSHPDGLPRDSALDLVDLDLIIVPGVAFDAQCNRLGHGKGYYDCFFDRYASKLNGSLPPTLGIALLEQIIRQVPTSEHDKALDAVVTPHGVISSPSLTP